MANFKGFSTINQYKKFTLTDADLIKRDLENAFSIKQGTIPGRPDVGTTIWSFIHEPNDELTRTAVKNEVTRIIKLDSRLVLNTVTVTYDYNSVQVACEVSVYPNADVEQFYITFTLDSNTVKVG